jgi:hypothetical protein
MVLENPTAPVKRGRSNRIDMNRFRPFLNIIFNITYAFLGCQQKK